MNSPGMWTVVRGALSMLAAPQGFTLSIAGTLAATIGVRGTSRLLDVWLFVVGANASFCLIAVVVGGLRRQVGGSHTVRVSSKAMLNAAPVAVVPIAVVGAGLIPNATIAYPVAGGLASSSYVTLLALLLWLSARTRPDSETAPGEQRE